MPFPLSRNVENLASCMTDALDKCHGADIFHFNILREEIMSNVRTMCASDLGNKNKDVFEGRVLTYFATEYGLRSQLEDILYTRLAPPNTMT